MITLGVHFIIKLSRGRARAASRSERDVDRHTARRESADAWMSKEGAPSGPHTPPYEAERRDVTPPAEVPGMSFLTRGQTPSPIAREKLATIEADMT